MSDQQPNAVLPEEKAANDYLNTITFEWVKLEVPPQSINRMTEILERHSKQDFKAGLDYRKANPIKYHMVVYARIRDAKYVRLIYEYRPVDKAIATEEGEQELIFVKATVDKSTLERGVVMESKRAAQQWAADNKLRLIDEFDFTL